METAPLENRPARLLTIEDDLSVRAGIVAFLEDSGYQMLQAESGNEGLAVFHQERPDAVLCDLSLPGMDGLDVLSVIAKSSPETPVIMVSGASLIGDAVKALQNGAWDFLTKPIGDMGMLESAVQRALDRARLLRENRDYQRRLESLNWKLSRSLERLRQDEEAGRKIQLRLLPEDGKRIGPYRFCRRQFPSMYLCGDFVDYFAIDERHTGFYMTDVSGHDAASAFVTVMLKTLMGKYRDALLLEGDETILDPARILERLNQDLARQELDKYCTMFFGVLDHRTNRLACGSAGQYPFPVMIESCQLRPLTSKSRPIGLFDDASYKTQEYHLPERFGLALVSDGILELLPPDTARTRLQNFLNRLQPELDLDTMIKGFRLPENQPFPDDVTFLLVTRETTHG
jgi:sigma-B regulation protein RsbU (phosphoserine phosphatase)